MATAAELIDKLQKLPPDTEVSVALNTETGDGQLYVESTREVLLDQWD